MFSFAEWACKQCKPADDQGQDASAISCAPVTCQITARELEQSAALKALGFHCSKHRRHQLKTKYGISLQEYYLLWLQQAGACAICRIRPKGPLFVDHCHVTGQVRGLVCRKCNMAIGFFKDDPQLARAATAYLEAARKRISRIPRPCRRRL
jgi:Recombination endonuclease VII